MGDVTDHLGRCTSCGVQVPLHGARTKITASGRVELECAPCARGERPAPPPVTVAAVEPPPPMSRPRPWLPMIAGTAAIALAAAVPIFGGSAMGATAARAPSPADLAISDQLDEPGEQVAAAMPEPRGTDVLAPRALPPIPERDGEPLDEWMPILRDWVHPVPGSPEVVPTRGTRIFGAHRDGVDNDCGGGHCGVDLEGTRGQPVVAVAWGIVSRIQRDAGGRGGRYVKLEHPDQVFTSYFHLDDIAEELEVGDEVEPGQPVGTLGRTGISISMPHLHFALEVWTGHRVEFIDPVPFLARSIVLPAP